MAETVIIGAGITGIATAYYLEQAGYYDYTILEKEPTIGGLCRSIMQDGFTFDYTGHLLHLSDPGCYNLVTSLLPVEAFETVRRQAFIYSHNTYTKYPFQINLNGLPHHVIVECIEGFVQRNATSPTLHFDEWVLANFGAGLARHFFFPYQQKIFDIDIHELSSSWTDRFVPATSLRDMLNGALGTTSDMIGYNAQFLYPRHGGIMTWVDALHRQISKPALCSTNVTHIDGINKKIICSNGREESFKYLVSTMPLTTLLQQLREHSATQLAHAIPLLRCNSIINFNLGLNGQLPLDAHWVYYPESPYPFYRIGFPAHLTSSMSPNNASSLSGECSFLNRSNEYIQDLTHRGITAAQKLFNINHHDVVTQAIINIPHAYVIFDLWRDKHLPHILKTLTNEYSIYSIGRYGAWKYASMQDALIDGKQMAEIIINHHAGKYYATPQERILS